MRAILRSDLVRQAIAVHTRRSSRPRYFVRHFLHSKQTWHMVSIGAIAGKSRGSVKGGSALDVGPRGAQGLRGLGASWRAAT